VKFNDDIEVIGRRVRLTDEAKKRMGKPGEKCVSGRIVPGIGYPKPPPGCCYVHWSHFKEPAPAFAEDLEEI